MGDGAVLNDDHSLRTGEIQVVFLNFRPASSTQVAALRDAARSGRTSEVENPLQRPQDPDSGHPTPLSAAAVYGHLQVIRLLLEANADKDKALQDGATPLYIAAEKEQLAVVRLLLEASADKDKAQGRREWRHPFVHRSSERTVGGCTPSARGQCGQGQGLGEWRHPFVHRS